MDYSYSLSGGSSILFKNTKINKAKSITHKVFDDKYEIQKIYKNNLLSDMHVEDNKMHFSDPVNVVIKYIDEDNKIDNKIIDMPNYEDQGIQNKTSLNSADNLNIKLNLDNYTK